MTELGGDNVSPGNYVERKCERPLLVTDKRVEDDDVGEVETGEAPSVHLRRNLMASSHTLFVSWITTALFLPHARSL